MQTLANPMLSIRPNPMTKGHLYIFTINKQFVLINHKAQAYLEDQTHSQNVQFIKKVKVQQRFKKVLEAIVAISISTNLAVNQRNSMCSLSLKSMEWMVSKVQNQVRCKQMDTKGRIKDKISQWDYQLALKYRKIKLQVT